MRTNYHINNYFFEQILVIIQISDMNDTNSAKQAARRIYKKISYQDGALGTYQLQGLLARTYEYLNIPFKASSNDIKLYEQVLDADRDGKVTLKDLEARAVQYLCSNTLISSISASSSKGVYKPQEVQSNYQNYNSGSNYSNYSQFENSSSATSGYLKQPIKYSEFTKNNYGGSLAAQQSPAYNYQYKSSFQPIEKKETSLSGFGNETVYTYEKNSVFSQSGYESNPGLGSGSGSGSERVYQTYNPASEVDYSNSYINKSYGALDSSNVNNYSYGQNYEQNYSQEPAQEAGYTNNDNQQRPYSEAVRQYLAVVGKVFLEHADPEAYNVTEDQVPDLLTDTYAVLGREGYVPSREDVETWMKLCDVNNDGKVEYQEYQYFVVKSLERSGLDLYD